VPRGLAAAVASIGALAVGLVQFRHGIVHLLDTVTYWSGTDAITHLRLFRTALAPSFSNFSAVDFAGRGGDLPFVDFPVGYPLVAGVIGWVFGARPAMQIVVVASLIAVAMLTVSGDRRRDTTPHGFARPVLLAVFGVLVIASPAMRLVTQGALSEPLFCAMTLALVGVLVRYREGHSFTPVAMIAACVGLLRFIGAPLAIVAGWEHYRRTRDRRRSALLTLAMLGPAATNVIVARAAGGGHGAGWRGLDRTDLEVTVRSIGGWFDARQGDIRRTYFTTDGPSWWSWPVAAAWLLLIVSAVVVFVLGRDAHTRRLGRVISLASRLTPASEIALVCAGVVWTGLVAGMAGFDALVIADNRLMLPVGVLTLVAVAWSIRVTSLLACATIVFAVAAVRPWNVDESFSDNSDRHLISNAAEATGATIIVTNDADAVHWDTGIPAAYAPLPVRPLTGEPVDVEAEYAALPCALLGSSGAVVLSDSATFSAVRVDLLDAEVDAGRLEFEAFDGVSAYYPTDSACD